MRLILLACLAIFAAPIAAAAAQETCDATGPALAQDVDGSVRLLVSPQLYQSMESDDVVKAQVYGYLMGRRLATAPVGSPYRACALAADDWFTAEFGRFSSEVLATYRAGLVGEFDYLMESVYGLDTSYMDAQTSSQSPSPSPSQSTGSDLPNGAGISLSDAIARVCPPNVDAEFSQAYIDFNRWFEINYLGNHSSYDRRWDERRYMYGHAMARLFAALENHPVRAAAYQCIVNRILAIAEQVSETSNGYYKIEDEQRILQESFDGLHNDQVRRLSGVTQSGPAFDFFANLQITTGLDLRTGSFAAGAPQPQQQSQPAPSAPADNSAAGGWAASCARAIQENPHAKPEFEQINTTYSNTKVYIAPVENILVFIAGGECKEWDWNEFRSVWGELDTVYPEAGGFYKIVNYKSRTRNEWTRIGYNR